MARVRRALGLMSGTSMDGIDVALLDTDGRGHLVFGPCASTPYGDADRALLRRAVADAGGLRDPRARPGTLAEAERLVTQRHAEAVEGFLARHALDPQTVDVIGFHGQTVIHRPDDRLTVQVGDGAALAARLGIDVVADLRGADVASGGQGAPLVPVFHDALARALPQPALVINVGGVANVTFLPTRGHPIACDTGPGNALLDDLMLARTGRAMDADGAAAAAGRVDAAALRALLDHPFFALPPPKSLDRNAFSAGPVEGLALPDAAATLTAFTAASIAGILDHLPETPARAVVCGGGARNPALMADLARRLPCPVTRGEDEGWNGDAVEAQAFAYLAVRSLDGLPLTFPATTGAPRPMTGGVLFPAMPRRAAS